MKIIGMIGGMSWESSLEYYRNINEETKKTLGNSHSDTVTIHCKEAVNYAINNSDEEKV
ncbi:MAG: putative racemase [Candidatus Izimaplasma bacterium HR2]|nr:MAG: putative racemase [Candidatus Izimaplasma bacterium HR2]